MNLRMQADYGELDVRLDEIAPLRSAIHEFVQELTA
jgi:hypothetical protein